MPLGEVGIALGHAGGLVPQEVLGGRQIVGPHDKMGGEGVPQVMEPEVFYPGQPQGFSELAAEGPGRDFKHGAPVSPPVLLQYGAQVFRYGYFPGFPGLGFQHMNRSVIEVYMFPAEVEYLPVAHPGQQGAAHNGQYLGVTGREKSGYIPVFKELRPGVLNAELPDLSGRVGAGEILPLYGAVENSPQDVMVAVCGGGGCPFFNAIQVLKNIRHGYAVYRLVSKESAQGFECAAGYPGAGLLLGVKLQV